MLIDVILLWISRCARIGCWRRFELGSILGSILGSMLGSVLGSVLGCVLGSVSDFIVFLKRLEIHLGCLFIVHDFPYGVDYAQCYFEMQRYTVFMFV